MKQPVLVSQQMLVPRGFRFAGIAAGIKKNGQPDLAMAEIAAGAQAAAVFTRNLVVAAPIEVTASGSPRVSPDLSSMGTRQIFMLPPRLLEK